MKPKGTLSLKDSAYEYIKNLIQRGHFLPGQFISERAVSQQLGMSKTPVHGAIERLAEQGFVTISPQRGVIVRALTPREISDHYDFRIVIEAWIMRSVAGRLTSSQKDALVANLNDQKSVVEGSEVNVSSFMDRDAEFHNLIAGFTGNSEFQQSIYHQLDQIRRLVVEMANRDITIPGKSYLEHRQIFEALAEGDSGAAENLLRQHLEHGKRFMLLGGSYGE